LVQRPRHTGAEIATALPDYQRSRRHRPQAGRDGGNIGGDRQPGSPTPVAADPPGNIAERISVEAVSCHGANIGRQPALDCTQLRTAGEQNEVLR
jgi:hypothetical protein